MNRERIAKIKKRLYEKSFFGNILALVSGSVIAQAITILSAPILSQLYSPAEMGVYSNYISILTLINAVVCLQYDKSIVLPEQDEDAGNILGVSICCVVIISAMCAAIIIPLRREIADLLHADKLDIWLFFLPLSLFTVGITTTLHYWSSRKRNLKRVAVINMTATGITSSSQIALGTKEFHLQGGMILGYILGHGVAGIIFIFRVLKDDMRMLRRSLQFSKMKDMFIRYKRFPIYVVPASLCDNLCAAMPSLLLAGFFGSAVSGYYALSYRLLALPISVISGSISQAFYPEAQKAYREGQLPMLAARMFQALLRIGSVPMMLFAMAAPKLIGLIFGSDWYVSGQYVQWLALWLLTAFLYSPLSCLFTVTEQQNKFLLLNAVVLITRLASLLVGGILGESIIAIAACGITGAIMAVVGCIYVLRQVGVKTQQVFIYFTKEFLHCIPYAIPTVIVMFVTGQSLWTMGVAVASGCVFLLIEGKNIIGHFRKS